MPINEYTASRVSRLTNEQKQQSQIDLIGAGDTYMENHEAPIIDINKPPVAPYKYQAFPKMVFTRPQEGQHPYEANKVVNSQEEHEQALADGWSNSPVHGEPERKKGRK